MTVWPVSDKVKRSLIELLSRNLDLYVEDNQEKHDHVDGYAGRDSN
jgi:hypothetical protein